MLRVLSFHWIPLTLVQLYGAIAFYLDNQSAIDAYRIRQEKKFQAIRASAEPLPEAMRRRIQAAREQLQARNSSLVTRFVPV